MKFTVEIDVPAARPGWGREQQWVFTGVASMVRLFASRLEFGQRRGSISGDAGASLCWETRSTPADEGKAA